MLRRNFLKSLSTLLAVSATPFLSASRSFSKTPSCTSLGKPTCSNSSPTKPRADSDAKLVTDYLADEMRNSWAKSPIGCYVYEFDETLAKIASLIQVQATG